ncbi:MAG: hypothetical protein QN209_12975, partial [Armatimonadota bacterium]|nr:hypothetical protein [Armatimonadota bacterium]
MRTYLAVVISAFLGAVIGGLILLVGVSQWETLRSSLPRLERGPGGVGTLPAPIPPTLPPGDLGLPGLPPAAPTTGPDPLYAEAKRLLNAGRLQEAQETYLALLLVDPLDQEAMRGLVTVRRRMARDDPELLRRQAATYQDAVTRGVETEEHYTIPTMELLAKASLLAAAEVEQERGVPPPAAQRPPAQPSPPPPPPAVQPTSPPQAAPPAPPTARARPTPASRPRVTPRPTRRAVATPRPVLSPTPRPAPPAPATPPSAPVSPPPARATPPSTPVVPPPPAPVTPQPPLDVNEPFVLIQIGPLTEAATASEI